MQIYIKSINKYNEILAYESIIRAVDIHRKAIMLVHSIIYIFYNI